MYDNGEDLTGEDPRARRRGARTVAESMGIPPAVGRRPRPEGEPAPDSEAGQRRGPERRGKPADAGGAEARRQLEAAEEALEAARAEAADNNDRYLRTVAEMDNLRKRFRQQQADQLQYGNSELITKLLPVVDNFHRALEHAPAGGEETGAAQEWVTGLTMVLRQLEEVLAAEGVTPIDAVGQPFDPNLHQAVMAEPSAEHDEDHVIDELQRGYMQHDRVLRPSMVKVARNS